MSRVINLSDDLEHYPAHTPEDAAAAHAVIDTLARAQTWPVAHVVTVKAALGLLGGDHA